MSIAGNESTPRISGFCIVIGIGIIDARSHQRPLQPREHNPRLSELLNVFNNLPRVCSKTRMQLRKKPQLHSRPIMLSSEAGVYLVIRKHRTESNCGIYTKLGVTSPGTRYSSPLVISLRHDARLAKPSYRDLALLWFSLRHCNHVGSHLARNLASQWSSQQGHGVCRLQIILVMPNCPRPMLNGCQELSRPTIDGNV